MKTTPVKKWIEKNKNRIKSKKQLLLEYKDEIEELLKNNMSKRTIHKYLMEEKNMEISEVYIGVFIKEHLLEYTSVIKKKPRGRVASKHQEEKNR